MTSECSSTLSGTVAMDRASRPPGGEALWVTVSGATCLASLMFLAVAVGAALLTFADVSPEVAQDLAAVSFVGAFLTLGAVIVAGLVVGGGRRRRWSELLMYSEDDRSWRDALPTRVIAVVAVCLLVLLAGTLLGIADMGPGSPEEIDGRYYSNNHGQVTEISEAEFERAIGAETRLFASIAGVFLSASAIGAGSRRNRLRSRQLAFLA